MRPNFFARVGIGTASALAACLFSAFPATAQDAVTVTINGTATSFSPPPIVQAGRVFVPLRGVFERLGASVDYAGGTINATGNGRDITLQIGSTQATVDGEIKTIDVAPFIVGESTFVPLRFISEALGAGVAWDETNRVVAIDMNGQSASAEAAPAATADDDDQYLDTPPPPLPVYQQPEAPAPNELWQPGYWAWGSNGYFWVPGTWVQAPRAGYLWTPGYWHRNDGFYAWNRGYWATAVGFYGGVNYGAGYYGSGYVGGRWSGNVFQYNTYVSHVNVTIVRNVYIDRTVYVNNATTRVSFNGGSGLQARPTAREALVARAPHLGLTAAQRVHIQAASQDRALLATVNRNRPAVLAVPAPLSAARPRAGFVAVKPSDRVTPPARPAAVLRLPASHQAPAALRPDRIPAKRPEPAAYHAPAAPPAAVAQTAPVVHAP
ncbi:MAG: stalk domain-containing protein, partial [Candidatus Velthaea sp.]